MRRRLIPGHQIFNARRPEVSWLRVLEFVRNQDEAQALRELEAMSEASIALAPTLQRYLVAALRLRAGPEATLHHAVFPTIPFGAHQLFYDIAEATRTGIRTVGYVRAQPVVYSKSYSGGRMGSRRSTSAAGGGSLAARQRCLCLGPAYSNQSKR